MKCFYLILMTLINNTSFGQGPYTRQCDELDIGKSLSVYVPSKKSPTNISHLYSLKRNSYLEHEVFLNLKFHDASNSGLTNLELNRKYKEKSQRCLTEKAHMFSDENGRSIKLTIYDDILHKNVLFTPPYLVEISIMKKGYRSHARAHVENADCNTLVHEYLHVLGLVDEYEEKVWHGLSRVNMYPNRSISTDSSWMRFHYEVSFLDSGIGKKKKKIYIGQMDAVLFPNCPSRNSLYYTCAKSAYESKKRDDVPAICKTKSDWLKGGPFL